MIYIKVPYIRLRGKKYGGRLSPTQESQLQQFAYTSGDAGSEMYTGNFQDLAKAYKSGEDPVENAALVAVLKTIKNPEKMYALHKAIMVIADKYGYDAPEESNLAGNISLELYQILTKSPNSYFVTEFANKTNVLITIDDKFNITCIVLPEDVKGEYFVTADENGNISIPKEAYDQNLEVM
jgi:hypothetical protein